MVQGSINYQTQNSNIQEKNEGLAWKFVHMNISCRHYVFLIIRAVHSQEGHASEHLL